MKGAKFLSYFMRIKCDALLYLCTMKYTFIFLFALCLATSGAYSQILNGGFEDWTGGRPDHWHVQGISQSLESHSGNFSVYWNLESSHISLILDNNARGQIHNSDGKNLGGSKIPFDVYQLSFWYKANFARPDWNGFATVGVSHNGVAGYWSALPLYTASSWTKMTFNDYISHTDSTSEDSIAVTFSCYFSGDIYIDDVSLDLKPSTVNQSEIFPKVLISITPNPNFGHANLKYHLDGNVPIHSSIFDITGREVMKLPSLQSAIGDGLIPFDCDGLPNGLYYLRFDAGGTVIMRKIIVQH